jgi:4-nitrophenyl phosphatase
VTHDGQTDLRALILDMDGVLWRDKQPIGDLPGIFGQIERRGWQVVLATNNATRSIPQYLDKLRNFGVNLGPEQVINSAQAAAHYLSQRHPQGGPVYFIGEDGLAQALEEKGFIFSEQDPLAVVVGMDRQFTYEKLTTGTRFIRAGAPFIGTNPDRTFPTPEGLIPGTGSILAALEAASYTKPVIVGKPAPEMYRVALERMKVKPSQTLVVGDRLETDIAGAQQIGCRTGLVLSGVTSPQAAGSWTPPPDWICQDLTALLESI